MLCYRDSFERFAEEKTVQYSYARIAHGPGSFGTCHKHCVRIVLHYTLIVVILRFTRTLFTAITYKIAYIYAVVSIVVSDAYCAGWYGCGRSDRKIREFVSFSFPLANFFPESIVLGAYLLRVRGSHGSLYEIQRTVKCCRYER